MSFNFKKNVVNLLVVSYIAFFSSLACSAELKIGIIDIQSVVQKANEFKEIENRITSKYKPLQDDIVAKDKAMQADRKKLEKNASVMDSQSRNKLQKKIEDMRMDLQTKGAKFQRDLVDDQNKMLQRLMNKLNKVVNEIAKNNNYDLILQRGGVPYAKPQYDISKQVLKALNARISALKDPETEQAAPVATNNPNTENLKDDIQ